MTGEREQIAPCPECGERHDGECKPDFDASQRLVHTDPVLKALATSFIAAFEDSMFVGEGDRPPCLDGHIAAVLEAADA